MLQLNPIQTRRAIEAAVMSKTPIVVWGAPGIGKSNIVEQIATDLGAVLIDTRLSQFDSVDLRGIPSVQEGMTKWNPPAIFPFRGNVAFDNPEMKDRLILWFLDEILAAMPAVQSTAFQLLLDHRMGEHELLPNVRMVAATNRETDRAGTNRMLSPLANRFVHVEMVPALNPWRDWAWEHDIDPRLIAFISFRPDLLSTFDGTKNEKVFSSPRTWEFLNRFLKQDLAGDILASLAHGTVGSGAATEFLSFLDVWQDMPDIDGILLNPDKSAVPPKEKPATMFAVTAALAARADKGTIDAIAAYVRRLPAEYAVRCIKDAVRRKDEVARTKAFGRFVTDYSDLMKL